ncbi:MAG: hypothetical protein GY827_09860 [Cytophagales bacterium]|nr:hypothetical protein [Cytophagales bacterium]
MDKSKTLFIRLFIFIVIASSVGFLILSVDNTEFKDVIIQNYQEERLDISALSYDTNDVYNSFPYKEFLQKINHADVRAISKYEEELTQRAGNPFVSQSVLSQALTNKLHLERTRDLDTLNAILVWADKYKVNEANSSSNALMYKSIHSHWYNYVANHLDELSKEKSSIKYDFKFRYLIRKCNENKFEVMGETSKIEKVVTNVIDQRWSYLFYRFWSSTSWKFKAILFSVAGIGLVLVLFGFKYIQITYLNRKKDA